eukprot:5581629-Heterocapsa_arctica.AAC.1
MRPCHSPTLQLPHLGAGNCSSDRIFCTFIRRGPGRDLNGGELPKSTMIGRNGMAEQYRTGRSSGRMPS